MDITDEYMREQLGRSAAYTVALLHRGPAYATDGADAVIWEHGRRNFALRARGVLDVVVPLPPAPGVTEGLAGLAIFSVPPDEVRALLDADPAVEAGILTYELHEGRSFPGDALRGH
jgi:hypothetical protein